MMIAASTRRPTAIARPPSVIVLRPTFSGCEQKSSERDGERNRQRHEQRRSKIAEQEEDDERDEHAA